MSILHENFEVTPSTSYMRILTNRNHKKSWIRSSKAGFPSLTGKHIAEHLFLTAKYNANKITITNSLTSTLTMYSETCNLQHTPKIAKVHVDALMWWSSAPDKSVKFYQPCVHVRSLSPAPFCFKLLGRGLVSWTPRPRVRSMKFPAWFERLLWVLLVKETSHA